MNKTRTMVQTRFTKGFEEDMGGSTGQPANPHPDAQPDLPEQCPDTLADNPGQAPGHSSQLPQWMGQVVEILRTRQRTEGHYSATAIAAACGVNDATIRNRWFKALNSEIADERILKVEGKYTELAMELFAHIAHCRDHGLSPAEWVLQVLRPALAAMPAQREIEPNAYQTALAQREQDNDSRLRAMEIKWAEMKARRAQEAQAQQRLSAADLERIVIEEKEKILTEVEARDRIRRDLLTELGLL